jgi:16S rRNA (guanine966-N2)-methyltransferase
MRITGGNARGILLAVPRGIEYLRPSTDFLREAVFSSLGSKIHNAFVLDLFAGVGSYGLESLSRGAAACIFVENNHSVVEAIGENAKRVKKSSSRECTTKIFCRDVFAWATDFQSKFTDELEKFDIIFIDPPYNMVECRGRELLNIFSKFLKNSDGARIVLEVPGHLKIDTATDGQSFQLVEMRRIGKTTGSRQPNALIYGKG